MIGDPAVMVNIVDIQCDGANHQQAGNQFFRLDSTRFDVTMAVAFGRFSVTAV